MAYQTYIDEHEQELCRLRDEYLAAQSPAAFGALHDMVHCRRSRMLKLDGDSEGSDIAVQGENDRDLVEPRDCFFFFFLLGGFALCPGFSSGSRLAWCFCLSAVIEIGLSAVIEIRGEPTPARASIFMYHEHRGVPGR